VEFNIYYYSFILFNIYLDEKLIYLIKYDDLIHFNSDYKLIYLYEYFNCY